MGCGNNKTENNNFLIMTVSTWNAMIGTAMQKNFAVETVGDNEYEKKIKHKRKLTADGFYTQLFLLIHLWRIFWFYTPWKHHRIKGFLVFSGGVK